jgi:hypothetical protein
MGTPPRAMSSNCAWRGCARRLLARHRPAPLSLPPSHAGKARVVGVAFCALALITVVAGAFALTRGGEGDLGSVGIPLAGSRPTATAVPRATPTSTATPDPYPIPTRGRGTPAALGAAPATCAPPAPAPRTLAYGFVGAIGGSPVWVAWFDGPRATKHLGPEGGLGYGRYGWLITILFVVEPGFTDPFVMRGTRLEDGAPLWLGVLGPGQTYYQATPSVAVVLDPRQPGLPDYWNTSTGLSEDWAAWDATLYLSAAGCYALEARWPGGSWRLTFAAGR